MNCCSCDEISRLIDLKLRPIFKILGFPQVADPRARIAPETLIKSLGRTVYSSANPGDVEVKTIGELNAAIAAAVFHRAGSHRMPARVPALLTDDRGGNSTTQINDAMEWQEWMLKQLDALIGQFPVEFKVEDDAGNSSNLEFKNLSEALTEIAGLLLGVASDSDLAANLALRATVEASKAGNAALIGQDYSKAIADYLGFKGEKIERKTKSTITPGKTKRDEILQESEQKFPGYRWRGEDSLQTTLNQLLLAAGIIKSALVQDWKPGDKVTGDAIKEASENSPSSDEAWGEFLGERRFPPARRRVPNQPDVEIRDLSDSSVRDDDE